MKRLPQATSLLVALALTACGSSSSTAQTTSATDTTTTAAATQDCVTGTHTTPQGCRVNVTPPPQTPDASSPSVALPDSSGSGSSGGSGSTVQCADGTYSNSGGIQGACSHHGGVQ